MKTVLILGGVAIGAFLLVSALAPPTVRKPSTLDNTSALLAGGLVAAGGELWDRLFGSSSSSSGGGTVTHTPISSGETIYV